jgi:plasmid stabilization system protein ParE
VRPIDFHPEAWQEAHDAREYYEDIRPGLGDEFRLELRLTLERIRENPELYGRSTPSVRVAPVHHFPYSLYYEILEDRIWIAAVGHNSRRPGYWKRRRHS